MRQYDVKNQKVVLDEEVKVEPLVNAEVTKEIVTPIKQEKVFIGATKFGKKYKVGEKIFEEISLMKDNFILSEENNRLVSKEAQSFKASFAKNISDAKLLTITKDNHEISLSLMNKKRSFKRFVNYECNNNDMLYKNIEDGVDLKYSCMEEGIKESLIINNKQDNYDFDFTLDIKDLTPKFNEETNTLELQKDGNTIYTILSPYMIDANEKRSDDCYYEISQEKEILTLNLRVNSEWVNASDRVFPVVIDPTIKVMNDDYMIMRQLVNGVSDMVSAGFKVGIKKASSVTNLYSVNGELDCSYLKRNLSSSDDIERATLTFVLNKENLLLDSSLVKIHKDNIIVKEISCENLEDVICIDITNNLKQGTTCKFAIEIFNDSLEFMQAETYNSFLSINSIYGGGKLKPYVTIEEKTKINGKDIVNTKEYTLGMGETTSVNVKNGAFIQEIPLTNVSHNSLNLNVSAIFDSKKYDENVNHFMSKGWRTNLHQFLVKSNDYDVINGCKDVTYIDGQGNKHILHESWYYLDDNLEKVYVNREDVFIDSDKKLKVYVNDIAQEVKYDVKNDDGLSFVSGSGLTEYIAKADLKATPYFQIKLKNVNSGVIEFNDRLVTVDSYYYIRNNNTYYCKYSDVYFENGNYYYGSTILQKGTRKFNVSLDKSGYYFKDFNGRKVQLDICFRYDVSQKIEDIYFNEDIQNVNNSIKALEKSFVNLSCGIRELNQSLLAISIDVDVKNKIASESLNTYYDNLFESYYEEGGYGNKAIRYLLNHGLDTYDENGKLIHNDYYDNNHECFNLEDADISKIIENPSFLNMISANLQLISNRITLLSKDVKYEMLGDEEEYNLKQAKDQLDICQIRLNEYKSEYLEYQKQLIQLKEYRLALIEEQRRKVNDFIVDENGNTLGFDGYGRLILIADAYENKIEITYGYDKDNKDELLSISSETQNIRFEYSKNKQLKYIHDNDGNKISFSYDNELDYITTPNNIYSFDYTKYFKLTTNLLESIEVSKTDNNLFVETRITQDKEIGENTEDINQETQVDVYHHYKFDSNKTYIYDVIDEKNETLIETIWFDLAGRIIKEETNKLIELTRYEDDKLITNAVIKTTPKVYKEISLASDMTTISEEYDLKTDNAFIKDGVSLLPPNYSLGLLLKLKNINSVKIKPIDLTISAIKESGSTVERYSYNNPECYSDLLILPILIRTEARKLKIEGTIQYSSVNVESIKLIALEDYETYEYNKDCVTLSIKNGCISNCRSSSKYPPYKAIRNVYGDIVRENYTYDSNNRLTSIIDSDGNVTEYYYDSNGKCNEQRSYNSYDASLMKTKKVIYDEKGRVINTLGQIKDEKGNYPTSEITYLANSNIIAKVKDYNNENTCYTYDFKTKELLSISSGINGVNNATTYGYKYGLLTSLSHKGLKINYEYDGKRRKTKVLVNGDKTIWYSYVDKITSKEKDITDGSYVTMNTKDGYFVDTYLDNDGTIKKSLYSSDFSSGEQTNTYNADNQLIKVESIIRYRNDSNVMTETIDYSYIGNNLVKSVKKVNDNILLTITNSYDSNNRFVETSNYAFDNTSYNYKFIRNNKHQLEEIIIKDSNNTNIINTKYEFDALNRISHQVIKLGSLEICNEYNYLKQDENSLDLISEEVTKIKTTKNNVISYGLDTNSYKYDVNGNIISIINDDYQIRYQYDKCNRLIREDNPLINKTIIYKYDNSGNILLKKNYDYSEDEILHNLKLDEYIYDCEKGLDHLIRYNGLEISYDSMGRPTTYKGNKLTWNSNGELLTYKDGSGTINYTYDINSIRTKKVVNGKTHNYVVNGTQILQEKIVEGTSTTIINYHYVLNKLVGFTYNKGDKTSNYIYRRNIQGDIIGIYDSLGNEVGGYAYDAYGKCYVKYKDNSSEEEKTILNTNPFRYRGYYYDNETQLYWVSSRYYSPELCRWISPDSIEYLDPQSINGLNLYAYCGNDPVNKYDPSGHFAITTFLICLGVGALVGGTLGGITAYSEGQDILTGVLTGALLGAAVGAVVGIGGAALSGAVSSVLGKTATDLISVAFYGGEFGSWEDYAIAFAFGGLTGSLGSVTGKFAGLAKAGKFAADVALRPGVNQLVKWGTRGDPLNGDKYLYDVITRAVTYGGSNNVMKSNMFGLNLKVDLGKCFYRSTFRSLYSYI